VTHGTAAAASPARRARRPLVLLTPKYLHHHRPATSALEDMTSGTFFNRVIDDGKARRLRHTLPYPPDPSPPALPGCALACMRRPPGDGPRRSPGARAQASDNTRHRAAHPVTGEPFLLPPERIRRVVLCAGQIYYRLRWAGRTHARVPRVAPASSVAACWGSCRGPARSAPACWAAQAHAPAGGSLSRRGALGPAPARALTGARAQQRATRRAHPRHGPRAPGAARALPARPGHEGAAGPAAAAAAGGSAVAWCNRRARARRWCRSTRARSWCGARRSPRTWARSGARARPARPPPPAFARLPRICRLSHGMQLMALLKTQMPCEAPAPCAVVSSCLRRRRAGTSSRAWRPRCASSPWPRTACRPGRCTTWAAPRRRPPVRSPAHARACLRSP